MGRKAKFDDETPVKKGPGRKAKKQKDPIFSKTLLGKFETHCFLVCILTRVLWF